MTGTTTTSVTERELPQTIDYYEIGEDGSVNETFSGACDVYIDELGVSYFRKPQVMLQVRRRHGPRVGVMRDTRCPVFTREYNTPKILLGIARATKT